MRSQYMIGLLVAITVIFAILVLLTRAAGMIRGSRLGVVGVETSGESDAQPALAGAAMGLVALILIALLYVGVTRWDWLGRPASHGGSSPVVSAAPIQSPISGLGAGASASPNQGGASPSPSK